MELVQITTTTETKAEAHAIASHLVEQRLAACVQIVGGSAEYLSWVVSETVRA